MRRKITKSKLFFHKSVNKSKIILYNIDYKAIIHKFPKFQANIFKNKKTLTFLWTTEYLHLYRAVLSMLNKNIRKV